MKTFIKMAIAGAALAAGVAHADTILPSTGDGQLILFVKNNSTNQVYARGLTNPVGGAAVTINGVLSQSALQAIPYSPVPQDPAVTFNYSIPTIAPDANLTTFLNVGSASGFSWTIMAGDGSGTLSTGVGAQRLLTTSHTDFSQVEGILNPGITDSVASLNVIQTQANGYIAGSTAGDGNSTPAPTGSNPWGGQWGDPTAVPGVDAPQWFTLQQDNVNTVGETDATHLYIWATNTQGSFASVNTYTASVALRMASDGTLSAVPVPAAVWLLGSGLLGLAGIGRRRKAVVAA